MMVCVDVGVSSYVLCLLLMMFGLCGEYVVGEYWIVCVVGGGVVDFIVGDEVGFWVEFDGFFLCCVLCNGDVWW